MREKLSGVPSASYHEAAEPLHLGASSDDDEPDPVRTVAPPARAPALPARAKAVTAPDDEEDDPEFLREALLAIERAESQFQ